MSSAGHKTINEKCHEPAVTRSQNTHVEQMQVVFSCGSVFGSSWKNNCSVPLASVHRSTLIILILNISLHTVAFSCVTFPFYLGCSSLECTFDMGIPWNLLTWVIFSRDVSAARRHRWYWHQMCVVWEKTSSAAVKISAVKPAKYSPDGCLWAPQVSPSQAEWPDRKFQAVFMPSVHASCFHSTVTEVPQAR